MTTPNSFEELDNWVKQHSFWGEIYPNGVDVKNIQNELSDYSICLDEIGKVYYELTNGRFSKPLTDSKVIIDEINERIYEEIEEGIKEKSYEKDKRIAELENLLRGSHKKIRELIEIKKGEG